MSIFLILYILKNIQCACTSTNFVEDFVSQQSWEQGTTFPIPRWLLFPHVDNLPTYLSPPEWAFVTTDEATRTVNILFSLPLCFSFRDVHSIPLDKCIIISVHHNSLTQIISWSWKFSRFRIFRVPPLKPIATTDLFNLFYISYEIPRWLSGKNFLPADAGHPGDVGSILGSGRSPGGRNGNPLQYPFLGNLWTEEPGRLQPLGSQRLRHHWAHMNIYLHQSVIL